MLVRVSRPKSAASGVLQRGHYPHPHSRHAGAAAGILSRVCVSSATPRGEEGGGRHTPDVWRGQLGCTDTQQQLHCTTGRQIGGIGTPAPGTCGQCADTGAQEHLRSSLELETKVREDFTITEKASTRAFYP